MSDPLLVPRGGLRYTVGRAQVPEAWYVPMPWHLRGTAQEILAGCDPAQFPGGCRGIEFRNGVQYLRYGWPEVATDG